MTKPRRIRRARKAKGDIFIVDSIQNHVIDNDVSAQPLSSPKIAHHCLCLRRASSLTSEHTFLQGNPKFQVKWQGFEDEASWTWEPLQNLKVSGEEILQGYINRLAASSESTIELEDAISSSCRGSAENCTRTSPPQNGDSSSVAPIGNWKPPRGSWEDKIQTIDGCEFLDNKDLVVYVTWKGGRKTRHRAQTMHSRCPQKPPSESSRFPDYVSLPPPIKELSEPGNIIKSYIGTSLYELKMSMRAIAGKYSPASGIYHPQLHGGKRDGGLHTTSKTGSLFSADNPYNSVYDTEMPDSGGSGILIDSDWCTVEAPNGCSDEKPQGNMCQIDTMQRKIDKLEARIYHLQGVQEAQTVTVKRLLLLLESRTTDVISEEQHGNIALLD
ncbi:hypothetical protein FDECE_3471 [Fusarium decemcellulare]|nr:hypothetical protein FDECE_3471 [Fusarium decemcellulare]